MLLERDIASANVEKSARRLARPERERERERERGEKKSSRDESSEDVQMDG